jgi:cold shock CspA family protein
VQTANGALYSEVGTAVFAHDDGVQLDDVAKLHRPAEVEQHAASDASGPETIAIMSCSETTRAAAELIMASAEGI